MFLWNLDNERYHPGYPYDNVKKIFNKHKKFIINYMGQNVEFTISKDNEKLIRKKYVISTVGSDDRTYRKHISLIIYDKNKNILIDKISKSDKISGKDIIKLAEIICKKIGATHVYLYDGATVTCKKPHKEGQNSSTTNSTQSTKLVEPTINLSLYMLLKSNTTFYGKYGYKILTKHDDIMTYPYLDKSFDTTVNLILRKLKRLKLEDIYKRNNNIIKKLKICFLNDIEYKKADISSYITIGEPYVSDNICKDYKDFIEYNNNTLFKYLPKKGNFIKELLQLYDKNCDEYNAILNMHFKYMKYGAYVFDTAVYIFNKSKYILDEVILLNGLLKLSVYNAMYYVKKL